MRNYLLFFALLPSITLASEAVTCDVNFSIQFDPAKVEAYLKFNGNDTEVFVTPQWEKDRPVSPALKSRARSLCTEYGRVSDLNLCVSKTVSLLSGAHERLREVTSKNYTITRIRADRTIVENSTSLQLLSSVLGTVTNIPTFHILAGSMKEKYGKIHLMDNRTLVSNMGRIFNISQGEIPWARLLNNESREAISNAFSNCRFQTISSGNPALAREEADEANPTKAAE